jgi:hypothetical protein
MASAVAQLVEQSSMILKSRVQIQAPLALGAKSSIKFICSYSPPVFRMLVRSFLNTSKLCIIAHLGVNVINILRL